MVRLDLERINSVTPYKLFPTERELEFQFITDYGVIYTIGFSQDELLDYEETYQFAIINLNHQKSPRDRKLRDTVVAFVYEFFAQSDRVMLYFCETGDERQSLRSRLFEWWFKSSHRSEVFFSESAVIPDEDGTLNYVTYITRQDNPNLVRVSNEFAMTVQVLRQKPE